MKQGGGGGGLSSVTTDGVTIQGLGTVASPVAIKAVQVDGVTVTGNGIVGSTAQIKAVQVDGTSITGAGVVGSPLVATLQRPAAGSGCSIATVTAQTFTTATPTAVTFTGNTASHDDGPYWASANPTRFTCLVQGWHMFSGYLQWNVNNTGMRDTRIRVNGSTTIMTNTIADTVALAARALWLLSLST